MSGEFTEVRGTAHDLQAWHALLTGDAAPFQRIEAAKEPTAFTGRFWRVVLDQVSMNLIEIEASEHTISRTAEHIKALRAPYYLVLFQVRGSSVFRQGGAASALNAGELGVVQHAGRYLLVGRDTAEQLRELDANHVALLVAPGGAGMDDDGVPHDLMW